MAKGRGKGGGPPDDELRVPPVLAGQPGDAEQTSLRVYRRTQRKLKTLAAMRNVTMHDLLDRLVNDILDHELLAEMERQAAQMRPNNHGKR